MPERDILRAAFDELEQTAMPHASPLSLEHAYATVKRRRTTRLLLASFTTVLLAAGGITFALVRETHRGPEVRPPGTTASPSPSVSPTASTNTGNQLSLQYDTARPQTQLLDVTLTVPNFRPTYCPSGSTRFTNGKWTGEPQFDAFVPSAAIRWVMEDDVTGDGSPDLVALMECEAGTDPGGYSVQLVAYARAGSTYSLIGQVAVRSGGVRVLGAPEIEPDGTIRVMEVTRDGNLRPVRLDLYRYRWNGSAFKEIGKTNVRLDTREALMSVSCAPVALVGTGALRGTLRCTVVNASGPALTSLDLQLALSSPFTVTPVGSPAPLTHSTVEVPPGAPPVEHPFMYGGRFNPPPAGATGEFVLDLAIDAGQLGAGPQSASIVVNPYGVGDIYVQSSAPDGIRATVSIAPS